MVCRNCGADLKPGIKYCLNCGEYLNQKELDILETGETYDDSLDDSLDEDNIDLSFKKSKQAKSNNKKLKDIIIYGVLFAILIGSILVIIFSNKETSAPVEVKPPTRPDNVVTMENYRITFSGELSYAIDGSVVSITDGENYTFVYKLVEEKYDTYLGDILEKQLTNTGNKIVSHEIKTIDSHDFIIYAFDDGKNVRYLYVTKVDENHVSMGNILGKTGGNWANALYTIVKIDNSVEFLSSGATTGSSNFDTNVISGNS